MVTASSEERFAELEETYVYVNLRIFAIDGCESANIAVSLDTPTCSLKVYCAKYAPQAWDYYSSEWKPCIRQWAHFAWKAYVRFPARTNNVSESHFKVFQAY